MNAIEKAKFIQRVSEGKLSPRNRAERRVLQQNAKRSVRTQRRADIRWEREKARAARAHARHLASLEAVN